MSNGGPVGNPQINRVPQGLFDILQLRSQAQSPTEISDLMSGVMELTDFFVHPRLLIDLTSNTSANSQGDEARSSVPNNEFWMIYSMTGQLVRAAATDLLQASVGIQAGTGGYTRLAVSFLELATLSIPAGQRATASVQFPRPLILNSGWDLVAQAEVCDLAAGNTSLQLQALIARFGPGQA